MLALTRHFLAGALLGVALLTPTSVPAQTPDVPRALTLQGRLTDALGASVADGAHMVTFRIWDDPVASAPANEIWSSGAVTVTTTDGLFTILLGSPPMPTLDPFDFVIDTSRWLGITVESDPELSPRIKLTSVLYGFWSRFAGNAVAADSSGFASTLLTPGATPGQVLTWDGGAWVPENGGLSQSAADDLYLNEAGDTATGSLAVVGDFSAGTESVEAPVTLRTHNNWNPTIGTGMGDVRMSDGVRGLSIGISSGGGGAGHVRLWPSGGSQLFTVASPTSGDQFTVDGNLDKVFTLSPASINTSTNVAPLTVLSASKWGPAVDNGRGDFSIGTSSIGLNLGVALAGDGAGTARIWTTGGLGQDVHLASPLVGDVVSAFGTGRVHAYNRFAVTDSVTRSVVVALNATTGDGSAVLPNDAVNPAEMLGEPGITSSQDASAVSLSTAAMTDLRTVTITTPTSGYIVVEGNCLGETSGTTGRNQGFVQIDETAGGSSSVPHYTLFGLAAHVNTVTNYFPIYVRRVYQKAAGTYTFRMEGQAVSLNAVGAVTTTWYHRLTATFYPTSYGSVIAAVGASEASGFEQASARTARRPDVNGHEDEVAIYEVDLRELEMKAARARSELQQAERDLYEARLRAQPANTEDSPDRR